jgi:sigma-E factor negative regulatory protein RseA
VAELSFNRRCVATAGLHTATFFERLHAEPTVLAPFNQRSSKVGFFALSAAASIMAMAFLAWLSVQVDAEPAVQQAQQRPSALRIASFPVNEGMNDYLLAHQEYSPSTDVRGASSYIRAVYAKQTVAGQ